MGKGNYNLVLAVDCETSGIAFGCDDPSFNPRTGDTYQSIAWGLVVAHADTLKPIDELYVELKFDPSNMWDSKAEQVHGLSREYLQQNGSSIGDAVCQIGNLVLDYWGPDSPIVLLGHNVASFDKLFLQRLMRSQEIELRFGSRHIDSSSIGFATFGTKTSDQLFEAVGIDRGNRHHNALDDARASLQSIRMIRQLWASFVTPAL